MREGEAEAERAVRRCADMSVRMLRYAPSRQEVGMCAEARCQEV